MNALAWIYATSPQAELRNRPRSRAPGRGGLQTHQTAAAATLDTLAAAYAEAGRFDDAVKTTRNFRAQAAIGP